MCLPTGSTPRPVYVEMARAVHAGEASFAEATVLLLDEYGDLDADDPARCDAMLRRDLLDLVDVSAQRYDRPDTLVVDLEAEEARYRDVVARGLDLAVVGVGLNGHVGMNEPGSTADSTTRRVQLSELTRDGALAYGARRRPTWGVTIGMAELLGASEVWVLARGPEKAGVTSRLVGGPIHSAFPASLFRDHPNAHLILDEPAARELAPLDR